MSRWKIVEAQIVGVRSTFRCSTFSRLVEIRPLYKSYAIEVTAPPQLPYNEFTILHVVPVLYTKPRSRAGWQFLKFLGHFATINFSYVFLIFSMSEV